MNNYADLETEHKNMFVCILFNNTAISVFYVLPETSEKQLEVKY